MSAGDFEVIGATLPGAPAVAIGRNRFIAWGETNVAADVEDLYRERLDASGTSAEFRGAQEPITIIPETIGVKGGEPVRLDVRVTRHGPLVSDAINANNAASHGDPSRAPLEPLAFRWTALDAEDTTIAAFLKLNEARNWDDFTAALRDFVVPSQNFVYADVDGHIGYYAPGRIPIRASGDGSRPAEGWTGDAEWTGWIPFDELPHLFDPPRALHRHRQPPADAGRLSASHSGSSSRSRIARSGSPICWRGSRTKLTPDDFRGIQADTLSLHAQTLLPLLLAHAQPDDARSVRRVDAAAAVELRGARRQRGRRRSSRRGFFSSRPRSSATSSVRWRSPATRAASRSSRASSSTPSPHGTSRVVRRRRRPTARDVRRGGDERRCSARRGRPDASGWGAT